MADLTIERWDQERWEFVSQVVTIPDRLTGAGTLAPPASNTGVLNTRTPERSVRVGPADALLLDWLAVTIPALTLEDQGRVLWALRSKLPTQPTDFGGHGYTRGLTFLGTGRILWHPDIPEMGVHVRLTSETLAAMSEFMQWGEAQDVLNWLLTELGGKVTRLDLALDTSDDVVSKAERAFDERHVTTRAQVWEVRQPKHIQTAKRKGYSVLVGSRHSQTYTRIYDKRIESGGEDPHFRLEFEYKDERAQAVAEMLLAGDAEGVRCAMLAHLDFKRRNAGDTNKARWRSAGWWVALLGVIDKRPLRLARVVKPSIERIGDWLDRQVGPALALWWVYCERQDIDLSKWVMSYAPRWGPRHRLILDTF